MQPIHPLDSRSYGSRNHYHRTEGAGFVNHGVPYHNPEMMYSGGTGTSTMGARMPPSVSQGTRSLGPVHSTSMYGDNFVPNSHHTPAPLSRSMGVGQMGFGNQCDSRANTMRSVPEIPHNFSRNPQDSDHRYFSSSGAPRELHDTRFEESSSYSTLRRCPKLYTCDICDKQFVRPSSLTTHRFSHTGEKPHSCSTCGKAFSVASNLRRHEITLHGPRGSSSGSGSYDTPSQASSGELQRAFLVGSTNSSIICQRGPDIYENLLPSHERFYDVDRNPPRRF